MVAKDNATHNVLQTGGQTRIQIEDQKDSQYIDISTPPQKSRLHLGAENDPHKHNFVLTTDGKGLIHTGRDHDVTVGANRNKNVAKNEVTTIGADRTESVAANEAVTIGAQRAHLVKGQDLLTVEKERIAQITKDDRVQVGANRSAEVAEMDRIATKNKSTAVEKTYEIKADEKFHLQQQGTELELTGEHVELKTPKHIKLHNQEVSIEAAEGGKLTINASTEVTIECGGCQIQIKDGQIKLNAPQGIKAAVGSTVLELTVSGMTNSAPKISSTGMATVEITGPMVKVN